ncbi:hypothetical protein DEU56DRAFT_744256 [Suillus clintonianus]|uniref:uncharacterized protein n=1 Tax=Suillus clintonianus TaxID=1904413 RepID=UPI001B8778F8|nr:uncharacterized protein DEU56DRAFT_744256 [Suillus clintonianus]KAG2124898.1 hypothetical protein DEU56DRAFT_744256 [Suillus clintonianus]
MADFTPMNPNSWRLCQRCNTRFESTVPFTYVRGKDGSGRTCCPTCTKHYEGRKAIEQTRGQQATSIGESNFDESESSKTNQIHYHSSAEGPSRPELVKAMSAAQRGDNIFPSQRFGHPAHTLAGDRGKMLPPPVPAHTSMGYTPNHAVHQLHRSKMAQAASSGRFHQVMIRVALHHLKPEGKSGTVLEMHKSPKLILYDPRQPSIGANEPVLQEFFVHATPKDPTPKFFANARVAILLVMTNAQFEDVLLWQEQLILFTLSSISQNIAPSVDADVQNVLTSASSIPAKKRVLQSQGSSNDSSPSPPRRPARKRSRKFPISEISEVLAGDDVSKDEDQSDVCGGPSKLEQSQPVLAASALISKKLFLPSQSQLQAAMKAQGNVRKQASSTIGAGCVPITFRLFDIPSIGFAVLVSTPFSTTDSKYTVAALTIDTSSKSMIGLAGSFKTCHPALISNADVVPSMSTSPPPSVLSAEQVVAKRVFFRKGQTMGRCRFAREDELEKTLDEVNCLYWGTSLLGMAYTFIDEMLKTGNVSQDVVVELPRLRLVRAALAIPDDPNNDLGANYLIEERISGKFVKYINNNSAVPAHSLEGREAVIGLFLCFVQHVQYHLTNNMVYLSDFQGESSTPHLTPWTVILTRAFSRAFMNNFGGGNCTSAFNSFKTTHICNKFCRVFGLQPYVM